MKKLILRTAIYLIAAFSPTMMATSTCGGITRNVAIDGNVALGGANGSNTTNWEINEENPSVDGVIFCYSWDDNYLYVGWKGGNKNEQHILFIDTDPQTPPSGGTGSQTGPSYGCQTPNLPFTANFFVNIQADYNEYRNWNGADWGTGFSGQLTVSSSSTNNDIEAIIPWTKFSGGRPAAIYLLAYCNAPCNNTTCSGNGFIYGATPQNSGNTAGCSPGGISTFVSGFSATITCGQAPNGNPLVLPAELLDFQAKTTQNAIQLTWETAQERDLSHYNIQRSANGQAWATIGNMHPQTVGTRIKQVYQWTDETPIPGDNYYRLQQIHLDGSVHNSHSVKAILGTAPLLRFAPNPVTGNQFRVDLDQRGTTLIRLFDARGQLMLAQHHDAESGMTATMDISALVKGLYYIQINQLPPSLLIRL